MTNRATGHAVIIDGAGSLSEVLALSADVMSIVLYADDTTGKLEIYVNNNTANVVVKLTSPEGFPMPVSQYFGGVHFDDVGVKVISGGTGVIYFR